MTHSIGPYEVVKRAGHGATSAVFRARKKTGGDHVAVKVLLRSSPDALSRFERERRLLADLASDGGIVPILDAGLSRDGPYVVMPFLEGGTLRERLQKGPLTVTDTIELGRVLSKTLGRCHARGIIHRDMKPENVLFDGEGRALIADLGLAKHFRQDALGASKSEALSKTGELRGTPGYSSPEQLRDAKSAGPPADVFALGAILYECLEGGPAFPGATSFEVYTRMEQGPPEPFARLDAPPWLRRTITVALDREPRKRPGDAAALHALLAAPQGGRRGSRRALVAVTVLLVLFALGVLGALAVRGGGPSPPPPPPQGDTAIEDFLERARLLCARGSFAEALLQATRAVERAPKDPRGYAERGRIELDVLDYAAAARDFERAGQLDPKLAVAWSGRGWALAARVASSSTVALEAAARGVELDPKDPMSWIARSFAIRPEDGEGAVEAARKAVALAPNDPRTHATLADAIGSPKGDWNAAMPHIERALALSPDDPYALMLRAFVRVWFNKELAVARAEFDRVLARAPRAHLALRCRSIIHERLGDHASALADVEAAVKVEPEDPRSWNELGVKLQNAKRYSEAETAYLRAIQFGPNYLGGWENRGRVRLALEDWLGASTDLKRATEIDSHDASIWTMRAMAELRLARWADAKSSAERAIAIAPDYADAWMCLGDSLYWQNERVAARDAYDRSVKLSPSSTLVYLARSRVRDDLGDLKGALEDIVIHLDSLPSDSPSHEPVRQRFEQLKAKARAR